MTEQIQKHFEKKAGDNLAALKERFETISQFHKDPLTAALLATSYYGIEELKMRLPRLNDILRNPFGEGELLHAISGLIILADGGPAEGAKAIQIYLPLKMAGVDLDTVKNRHLLGLLSIICGQARTTAEEIKGSMQDLKGKDADREEHLDHIDEGGCSTGNNMDIAFVQAATAWILKRQQEEEKSGDENSMAYALLVGMRDEVATILEEN